MIETINYFSGEDPSGNNKYLEWMTKNWLGLGKDKTYAPLDYEIVEVIKLFHRNIQRIQNKDINSYSYKELRKVVKKAEKQRKEKELEKEAKKQKKVIYEPVKLEQNYRNFDFESPWEGTNYIKEIKNSEKDGKKN